MNKLVGSRAEVFHGTAYKTSYGADGLTKEDLVMGDDGRIKSKLKAGKVPTQLKPWLKAVDKAMKKKKIVQKDGEPAVMVKGALLKETKKIYKKM
jgi:DVNP family